MYTDITKQKMRAAMRHGRSIRRDLTPNSLCWREGMENLMGLLCQLDLARTSTKRDRGKRPGKGQRLSPSYLCREGDKSDLHFNLWNNNN